MAVHADGRRYFFPGVDAGPGCLEQAFLESKYGAPRIKRKTEKGEILKWSGKLVDLTEQTDLTLGSVTLTWRSVSSLNPSSGTPAK